MANDTPKIMAQLTGKLRVYRECAAILFWVYFVVKLFIFDLDVWVLNQISPGLAQILDYKLFAVVVAVVVLWIMLGRTRFTSTTLYIIGYPLVVLFWKLPILAFRKWPLFLAFGPVIYRAIATFPATFLFY